jgi:two-component system, sensor histidine kinase
MLRVLIVDDCPDTTRSLSVLTRLWGHEARVAHDGARALEEARGFRPDVVLLDIGMPRLDGLEAARQLRQTPGMEGVMLVAVTGHGREEDRHRASQAGFDYFLLKPFSLESLEHLLTARARSLVNAMS